MKFHSKFILLHENCAHKTKWYLTKLCLFLTALLICQWWCKYVADNLYCSKTTLFWFQKIHFDQNKGASLEQYFCRWVQFRWVNISKVSKLANKSEWLISDGHSSHWSIQDDIIRYNTFLYITDHWCGLQIPVVELVKSRSTWVAEAGHHLVNRDSSLPALHPAFEESLDVHWMLISSQWHCK